MYTHDAFRSYKTTPGYTLEQFIHVLINAPNLNKKKKKKY